MADASSAAAAAMAEALRTFNTQLWTLYGFDDHHDLNAGVVYDFVEHKYNKVLGVLVTVLRTYARVKSVGIKSSQADDFLIWIAIFLYTTQCTLIHYAVNFGHGLANNSMTDAQRAALSLESTEYHQRVWGSKVQVAGWTCYICLIFTLKLCVLIFYIRLMEGLPRIYQIRIWIGFVIVVITSGASILTIYSACQPFSKCWQINPDPGKHCQGAIAPPIVWVTFISSVLTDIYLIFIPLSVLWATKLKCVKKIGATVILGAGVFVLVCSLLKTVFVITDPINGAQLAGEWGTREAFVSVITTKLPIVFPLFKSWLKPFFGSALSSTQDPSHKYPSGFRTIGGGYGGSNPSRGKGSTSNQFSSGLSATESEERINKEFEMNDLEYGKGKNSCTEGRNCYLQRFRGHRKQDEESECR